MLNHICFTALCSLFSLGHGVELANTTSAASATVHWLEGKPAHNYGTTFGLPWPAGKFPSNSTTFSAKTSSDENISLRSWVRYLFFLSIVLTHNTGSFRVQQVCS